ncbi:MAG: sugar phosphate isomerase/epimerase [Chloroflexi bacterium]|nr:sugar phosphate isomerase/epimerase [Chloroflexota bacterium]
MADTTARLAAQGYDGVELLGDLARYPPHRLHRALAAQGLAVLSITPSRQDLAHPDQEVRARALDYYQKLLEFAVAVGCPIVSCHGAVGRVRALSTQEEEYALLVNSLQLLARRAQDLGVTIALECLNRYESHLLNTAAQALRCLADVGSPAVGVLMDAYHMNIEEADPAGAILATGRHLALFHAADSNRQAVGRGHTDFAGLLRALREIGYDGSIIVECTAAGPDPFTPAKGPGWREEVARYTAESLRLLRLHAEAV